MKKVHTLRTIIIPLIFFEFLFFNFSIGPIHITSLRVFLALTIVAMFFTVINKKIVLPSSRYVKFACVFFYFWLLYSVFQLFYVQDFGTAVNKIFYLIIYFLIIFIFTTVNDKQEWTSLMRVVKLVGLIIILICIWEIITQNHLATSRFYIDEIVSSRQSTAVFFNENDLGLFLVMIFPLYFYDDERKTILIRIFAMICILIITLLNENHAALLGLGMQIFFMVLFSNKSKKFKRGIYIMLALGVLVLSKKIYEVVIPLIDQLINSHGSLGNRMIIYSKGLHVLKESIFLGVGPGNFEWALDSLFVNDHTLNPHNWWIELLVNSGLLIFTLYLMFFIGMIIETFKIYKKDKEENRFILAITIVFVGFIVGSMGPSTTFDKTFVWLFYGLGIGAINVFTTERLLL